MYRLLFEILAVGLLAIMANELSNKNKEIESLEDKIIQCHKTKITTMQNYELKGSLDCSYATILEDFKEAKSEDNITLDDNSTIWY